MDNRRETKLHFGTRWLPTLNHKDMPQIGHIMHQLLYKKNNYKESKDFVKLILLGEETKKHKKRT